MKIKHQSTKKLFYKKYPYKLVFSVINIHVGKWRYDITMPVTSTTFMPRNSWNPFSNRRPISEDKIKKTVEFVKLMVPYLKSDHIKHRVEYDRFLLYCEDDSLIEEMSSKFSRYLVQIWKPASDDSIQMLNSDVNLILCNKLPFNTFNYKVSIRLMLSDATKSSFYNWIKNSNEQETKFKCPQSLISYLLGQRLWTGCNYFYVKSQDDLLFLHMLLDKHILKIEKYHLENSSKEVNILSNKDNIDAGIEQTI